MKTIVTTTTLYQFDELSPEAQQTAIDETPRGTDIEEYWEILDLLEENFGFKATGEVDLPVYRPMGLRVRRDACSYWAENTGEDDDAILDICRRVEKLDPYRVAPYFTSAIRHQVRLGYQDFPYYGDMLQNALDGYVEAMQDELAYQASDEYKREMLENESEAWFYADGTRF